MASSHVSVSFLSLFCFVEKVDVGLNFVSVPDFQLVFPAGVELSVSLPGADFWFVTSLLNLGQSR